MLSLSRCLASLLLIFAAFPLLAQMHLEPDPRYDSLDVQKYDLSIDLRDMANKKLSGVAKISLKAKKRLSDKIRLDLAALEASSVLLNNKSATFKQSGEQLFVTLAEPINAGQEFNLEIEYAGSPKKDAAWGGFFFSTADGGYAFNMGVGMASQPHNYGRVWFPCFDNFQDKASYEFNVVTPVDYKAFCNGTLLDSTITNEAWLWHYKLEKEIPTYIANVAVGKYTTVKFDITGPLGTYKGRYGVVPQKKQDMLKSFVNLPKAVSAFEKAYGKHPYDMIGYVVVPFSSGAMEHATNISYPRNAVNGNLQQETLYAHELAHHWWGDHVTCNTSSDMWLNEGFARYSEFVFLEETYGIERYYSAANANRYRIITQTIPGEGNLAISPVTPQFTYSGHVYNKGADVIHGLRSQLGREDLFKHLTSFIEANAGQNISSFTLRDYLSERTEVAVDQFFSHHIFNPGYSHFGLYTYSLEQAGSQWKARLKLRQVLRRKPEHAEGVQLPIFAINKDWSVERKVAEISGDHTEEEVSFSKEPTLVLLDLYGELSMARTSQLRTVKEDGSQAFESENLQLQLEGLKDSALMLAAQHWVGPYDKTCDPKGIRVSNQRYWTISGIWPEGLKVSATMQYDATRAYLDSGHLVGTEDSLVLLYRGHQDEKWTLAKDIQVTTGSNKEDGRGNLSADNLKPGFYALGMWDVTASQPERSKPLSELVQVYPNPAESRVEIRSSVDKLKMTLLDGSGRLVWQDTLGIGMGARTLDLKAMGLSAGPYLLRLQGVNELWVKTLMIK